MFYSLRGWRKVPPELYADSLGKASASVAQSWRNHVVPLK